MQIGRRIILNTSSSKYVEVNAIKSDGVAYCVIPKKHDSSTTASVTIQYHITDSSLIAASNANWFGAHGASLGAVFIIQQESTKYLTSYNIGYESNSSSLKWAQTEWASSGSHTITVTRNSSYAWNLDGTSRTMASARTAVALDAYLLIFAANAAWNTGTTISPASITSYLGIEKLTYSDGNGYTLNLIPVLNTATKEYGFYDSTLNIFIGNAASSGSLLLAS